MNWKPSREDKQRLRAAAAQSANLEPTQIALRPALRVATGADAEPSFNDWMWGGDALTDLYDNGFTMRDFEQLGGCPVNSAGKARVDFYVYQLGNNGFGIEPVDLVCNVAAIVETVDNIGDNGPIVYNTHAYEVPDFL